MQNLLRRLGLAGVVALGTACPGTAIDVPGNGPAPVTNPSTQANVPAGFVELNNCTPDAYVDRSSQGADRTIHFGIGSGYEYDPPCLIVHRGQQVRFSGLFALHPLNPGIPPGRLGDPDGTPGNPVRTVSGGSTATFTYDRPGIYPYYCTQYCDISMFGAIWVQ